jgi:hypothetical protein
LDVMIVSNNKSIAQLGVISNTVFVKIPLENGNIQTNRHSFYSNRM